MLALGIAQFILDLDPQLSDSLDADLFLVVFMAIDGEEQIGDKDARNNNMNTIGCFSGRSCNSIRRETHRGRLAASPFPHLEF